MKLIVGLGNPGIKYEHTRHNAGFLAVQAFARRYGLEFSKSTRFKSLICEGLVNQKKFTLALPQLFMNHSGKPVQELTSFYKLLIEKDLLVVHDDTDLPLGTIKSAFNSSSAGHNGVQNVFDELATQSINRIRIGVETRGSKILQGTEDFVLQNFSDEEYKKLETEILPKVLREIENFVS